MNIYANASVILVYDKVKLFTKSPLPYNIFPVLKFIFAGWEVFARHTAEIVDKCCASNIKEVL